VGIGNPLFVASNRESLSSLTSKSYLYSSTILIPSFSLKHYNYFFLRSTQFASDSYNQLHLMCTAFISSGLLFLVSIGWNFYCIN